MGPLSLARARVGSTPPPITFYCLERYRAEFARQLTSNRVLVRSVESEFRAPPRPYMVVPDHDDLETTVRYILDQSLQPNADVRRRVNAKNLWSLWSVYRYGGYHMDTGVVWSEKGRLNLPPPTTFVVPMISDTYGLSQAAPNPDRRQRRRDDFYLVPLSQPQPGGSLNHLPVRNLALPGVICSTVHNGLLALLGTRVGAVKSRYQLPAMIDVWLTSSPPGDPIARRALEWYIEAWFRMESETDDALQAPGDYKSASRSAIISAVATAISHSATGQCNSHDQTKRHVIPTTGTAHNELPSLNVTKFGFGSHR